MNKFVPNCGVWMSPNAVERFERLNGEVVSGEVTQSTFEIISDMIKSTITSFYERKLGILILYYRVI